MTRYARSTKSPKTLILRRPSKLVGKALAALAVDHSSTSTAADAAGGTASSPQPDSAGPRYREGLTVIVCGSWNATRHRINAEMLATRDLVDAVTLRATLLAACYHDNVPGPGQMHRACLSSFERVFVDDAGQLETVKTLTGNVGHCAPRGHLSLCGSLLARRPLPRH